MSELSVTRWRRYGKDRLYVNDADGNSVGWLCRHTGTVTVEDERRRDDVLAALQALPDAVGVEGFTPSLAAAPALPGPTAPSTTVTAATSVTPSAPTAAVPDDLAGYYVALDYTDLAVNRPGTAAREQAIAHRKAAPVRTFAARMLGRHTDERAWRIGADGEELVAVELDKLGDGWQALHAIPVGTRGSDIDHLVIGPAGVFTINAKHHPGAKVWVGGDTVMVNGQRRPYVRNARHEAERAARLLSAALGFPVAVTGLVAVVGAEDLTVKAQPVGVAVVGRRRLRAWVRERPERLDSAAAAAIYDRARRSRIWR